MSARGRFITLEGGEGAGKSLQARRLEERLKESGIRVLRTREPGGSPQAEILREAILSGFLAPYGPEAEALAFAAARVDHLDITILPAEQGLGRAAKRRGGDAPDRFESEGLFFHETLRRAFLAIAEAEPERCVVIDAASDENTVADAIWSAVESRLDPASLLKLAAP